MAKNAAASKKPKADNVVALRKNTPADDAVVALNLGKMKRAKEEFESASGSYRNTLKHVEAKGVNLAAAKRAIAIQKSGKADETLAELTKLFEYLKILGIPFTKAQLDLFAVEAPRTPGVDKAKEHGRYCGIMGLGHDQNPYSPDSEQGQAWMAAHADGQEERKLVLAMEPSEGSELLKGETDDEVFDEEHEDEFDAADPAKTAAE